MNKRIGFILMVVFGLMILNVKAGILDNTVRLTVDGNGNPISTTSNNQLEVIFAAPTAGQQDLSVTNIITFGIDHESPNFYNEYDAEVTLDVTTYNASNVQNGNFQITLNIGHHPLSNQNYTDAVSHLFSDAYRFVAEVSEIKVDGVLASELPKNTYIDGFVAINKNYDFVTDIEFDLAIAHSVASQDCNAEEVEMLTLTWSSHPAGAFEYQLEWAFVNSYDGDGGELLESVLPYDFKNNSTRVTTASLNYKIPLLFEKGYILYRVRAVGKDVNGNYLFGIWTNDAANKPEKGTVDQFTHKFHHTGEHDKKKNWQLTTTFAEEGKKKEVINYADGSNRSRQSVTRINSTKDVIVAETIYDFQGRPAINVLPVPVKKEDCEDENYEPAIRFYPEFNVNDGGVSYTKQDFDLDDENNDCVSLTNPMGTQNGASNYYSPINPDKNNQQAFLPDAKKYPFTQVEYTPDNTGRIRRQSGVGEDFMLNTTHETKYLYGKPDQIYLDRLFGSEVGYAAHYKKNAVIDANGQVSVSYLDQEGRVVATALAGTVDNGMIPLESETDATKQLTVDYFEKNAVGVSSVNTINTTGNGIEFSKEILVIIPGDYIISYDVNNDPFEEECLPDICFNCVYELEVKITDGCGEVIKDNTNNDVYFSGFTGSFIQGENGVTFTTNCENNSYINNTHTYTANLVAGNYTISKTLILHQPAIDYYAEIYKDAENNTCGQTLQDFIDAEMAQVDTSSCYITCESCVAALGTKEDFVSNGVGTAIQYDLLVKECMEPCDIPSLCETRYQQLLADVSPGGQYGKYLNNLGQIVYDLYWLSVFSDLNYLPINYNSALWRIPNYEATDNYAYYDEFGDSARVTIVVDNSTGSPVYIPNVTDVTKVYYHNASNTYYTYPQYLSLSDFMNAWQPSWAKSLVMYHPEYCYYETCNGYTNEDLNGSSSDAFDKLLMSTKTFANAVTAGLIIPDPSNTSLFVFNDYFTANTTHPYDPFWVEHPDYAANFQVKFNDYSSGFNMLQVAAIMTNCGATASYSDAANIPLICKDFGNHNIIPGDETDDDIWNLFVSLYLGQKQVQQAAYEQEVAMGPDGCYNGCIGETGYQPYADGFFSYPPDPNQFYNMTQPCNFVRYYYYTGKTKRFQTTDDLPVSTVEETTYQHYLQTGQCPNAFNLQQLFSELALKQKFIVDNTSLSDYGSFVSTILSGNNYDLSSAVFPPTFWEIDNNSGNIFQATIAIPDAPAFNCAITFDASVANLPSWDWTNVIGFSGLQATGTSGGLYTFDVVATINDNGTISHHSISGTTCLDIQNCQFQGVCEPNELAVSVQAIMSLLAVQHHNPDFDPNTETSPIVSPSYNLFGYTIPNPDTDPSAPPTIQDPTKDYEAQMNLALLNTLQSTNTELVWSYLPPPTNTLRIASTTSPYALDLHLLSVDPVGYANILGIAYFNNIQSENEHYVGFDAYDINGDFLATYRAEALLFNTSIQVYTPVEMGKCELPRPVNCSETEHLVLEDLNELLKDVLVTKNYNVYASPKMTTLLQSHLPANITSNESSTSVGANWLNLNIPGCTIALTIDRVNNVTPALNFTHVVDLGAVIATGPIQQNNYYNFYATALFDNGNDTYVDTIRGSSCLPLKNCDQCTVYDLFPDTTTPTPPIPDPGNEASRIVIDDSPITYREYKQTVDSVNVALNLTEVDSNYIKPVDYKTYFKKRYTTVAKTYKHFAKGFNPEMDDISYLKKPEKFNTNYGHLYNMEKEYHRYTKAVQKYNSRIVAPLDSMQVMDIVAFTKMKVPVKHNNDYVNYLQEYPQQDTIAAKELTDFFVDEQVVMAAAEPTDSCEILYNEYTVAYNNYSDYATKECMVNLVLASYDDVVDHNLCCSAESRDIFRTYIATFDTSLTDCPKNIPLVDVGNTVCDKPTTDPRDCVRNFELYVEAIYAYNESVHAQQNNHQLFIFPSKEFALFEKMGFCECVGEYLNYLYSYINDTTGTLLPLPDLIYNVGTCTELKLEECTIQYFQYDNAINKYNESDFANQTNYYLTSLYNDEETFKQAGACGETMYRYMEYLEELVTVPIDPNFPPQPPRDFEQYSEPVNDCEDIYNDYVQTIADFNASTYAQQNNIVVFDVFGSAEELINNTNACECVSSYTNYLLGFINQGTPEPEAGFMLLAAAEPTFSYIEDFCKYKPASDCDNAYLDYMESLQTYNSYVLENDFDLNYSWPVVTQIYSSTEFTSSGMCDCVEPLMAYINAVTSGYNIPHNVVLNTEQIAFINNKLDLDKHCLEPPCVPAVVPMDTITPGYIEYANPCVEQMLSVATHNAEQAYNQYIQDVLGGFADQYRQHCLGAIENLTATFDDKEYHYTLYYYDQAGNLVRTIPPEGVDVLPTTSSFDAVSQNINSDRTNSERTIFTNHGLPTTYLYNSLNQLVRQDVPDHDKMDLYNFSLTAGLDNNLVVTAVQFVNNNKGYLTGYKNMGSFNRGYLYTTSDGGVSWTRLYDLVASNLKKVQWIDDDIAYAIGSEGILVHTIDGGSNWDMVDLYHLGVSVQLNDLYFTDATHGIAVGNNGVAIGINGTTPAVYSIGSSTTTLTGVTKNGSNYYVTALVQPSGQQPYGTVFTAPTTSLSSWTQLNKVQAPDYNDVVFVNSTVAYAGGNNGLLVKTINAGADWYMVETTHRKHFKQLYFLTENDGVALLDGVTAGSSGMYSTNDGGVNWTAVNASDVYHSFYLYKKSATTAELLAVGDNGKVERVLMQSGSVANTIGINFTTPLSLKAVWCKEISPSKIKAFVSDGNDLYYCENIKSSSPTWRNFEGNFTNITHINAENFTVTLPAIDISGIVLDGAELIGFNINYEQVGTIPDPNDPNAPDIPVYDNVLHIGTAIHNDVADVEVLTSGSDIYAYRTSGQMFAVEPNSQGFPTIIPSFTFTPPANYSSLALFNNSTFLLTATDGKISNYAGSWLEQTEHVRPHQLNDISLINTQLVAVGKRALLLAVANDNTTPHLLKTNELMSNWNALKAYPTNNAIIVGDGGVVKNIDLANNYQITSINTNSTEQLNDVAVVGTDFYIAGNNGSTWFADNVSGMYTSILGNGGISFNGVAASPSGKVVFVGNNSSVFRSTSSTMYKIKQVFTPALRKVHFTNAAYGYVVGDNYTARYTTNGGQSFGVVLPQSGFVPNQVPQLTSVFTTKNNEAYLTGKSQYLGKATALTTMPVAAGSSGDDFNDITFTSTNHGFIVGGNGSSSVVIGTTNGGANWNTITSTANALNGIHGFKRSNTFVAVGDAGQVVGFDGTNTFTNNIQPTVSVPNLHDVYFHDDINGYAVGENGTLLKTTSASTFNTQTGVITALTWDLKPLNETLLGQTLDANKNLYTVDFADRYNGFVGGEYTAGSTSVPMGYARLFNDESEMFSTRFFYDRLGRLVASQNTKQFNATPNRYSYTLYDVLGRIKEVGEKDENTNLAFSTIFGADVSGLYNPNTIDDTKFLAWVDGDGERKQVTKTYYDVPMVATTAIDFPTDFAQENLRKRVATVTYEELFDNDDETYQFATHYHYDIHGNVKSLLHDNPTLSTQHSSLNTQRYKRMDYTYDLISGNVKMVSYQNEQPDAWHHAYEYDADNRIHAVYTSTYIDAAKPEFSPFTTYTGGTFWEEDARYHYYHHGPLARVELGENNVQGVDYAYMINNWQKGINAANLNPTNDMGKDGETTVTNSNRYFARDAFSYTLNYFNNDYESIETFTTPTNFIASTAAATYLQTEAPNLYNGNISSMVTSLIDINSSSPTYQQPIPQLSAYQYDRLNRVRQMKAYRDIDLANNTWGDGSTYDGSYETQLTYDANGNILTMKRNGAANVNLAMDDFTYTYKKTTNGYNSNNNQLMHVNDNTAYSSNYANDLDDQGVFSAGNENYAYDEIGNQTQDKSEDIIHQEWNVYGKVQSVTRYSGSTKQNLVFNYNAQGKRIAKHLYLFDANDENVWENSTYYVHDAQGNVMAVYNLTASGSSGLSYKVTERNIYGSSSIGANKTAVELIAATTPTDEFTHTIGDRHFNLTNFRNDVLTTITDKKIPIEDDQNVGMIAYYNPSIVRISDTYLYGMPQPERSFGVEEGRLGYQNQEMVNEINGKPATHYTADYWEYNTLTARRENNDPVVKPFESPYSTFSGNPIYYSDVLGNTVEGATEEDAQQSKQEISNAFNNNKNFDQFFKLGEDGKTFEKIKLNDFNKFLTKESGFNEEQKALARGLVKTINASYNITVKFDDSFGPGGLLKATGKTTAIAIIGLANSYLPFGGGEKLQSNRTAIFIHEVVGEGRVLGNTGDFNFYINREESIRDNKGDPRKDFLLRKIDLEIIQTENLYNSYRTNGFLRSGGEHYVPLEDQNKIGLIPNQLKSLYYVTGEALEKGGK